MNDQEKTFMSETEPHQVVPLPVRVEKREIRVVNDPIAVLDTARFEHMQRIATVMAESNLIPDALCKEKVTDNDGKVSVQFLPIKTIISNCFLVVNQAVRWHMDPFAVAQCVSVVHGKLCYEGKLIAAVLNAGLDVDLEYEFNDKTGDAMGVTVTAAKNGKPVLDTKGERKAVAGTVADWKTTNTGSPWSARGGHQRMLRYRGAREWARVHAPGLMLGVYSDDEIEDEGTRALKARDVTPPQPSKRPPPPEEPAKTETKAPPPPAEEGINPEELLAWIDGELAVGMDGGSVEAIYNSVVEPNVGALLPPDQDEALALLKKHMRRVEP